MWVVGVTGLLYDPENNQILKDEPTLDNNQFKKGNNAARKKLCTDKYTLKHIQELRILTPREKSVDL